MGRTIAPAILAAALLTAGTADGQQDPQIVFDSDLPRVMVFLKEEGATAATELTRFLAEAGFEVIDPSFAKTAAEQERARRALAGDNVEATALGRDLGAQVIILGSAPSDAAANPVDASLQVGTAALDVRALRLDDPRLIAMGSASGRAVDATPQGAATGALRRAAEDLLYRTAFLGDVANDWAARPWNDDLYWQPTAADAPAASSPTVAMAGGGTALSLTLISTEAHADTATGTRGVTVVGRPGAQLMRASVLGIVSDPAATVTVGRQQATVRAPTPEEQARYDTGTGALFESTIQMPGTQDTLRVVAEIAGARADLLVRPMIARRWAVVIGVSSYTDERIRPLRYAANDARAMYDFLRSPGGGEVPEDQIRLLLNEDATTDAIREALFVFLQQAGPSDHVTVYVASHGSPDPNRPANLYILPYDTDADALASTAFPMWDFKTAMRRQIAAERVVVIADACHTGALAQEANPIGGAFSDLFTAGRRVTLSAADTHELSREGARWGDGHGVFTFSLLEGLAGSADSDGNGIVTFAEAAAYVQTRVRQETSGEQNPQRAGTGDLPIGYLSSGGGS